MTALVGGTVEQTLSACRRKRTGLPRMKTHEAGGEDFADFVEPLCGGHAIGI
jgi:hypothetical protein